MPPLQRRGWPGSDPGFLRPPFRAVQGFAANFRAWKERGVLKFLVVIVSVRNWPTGRYWPHYTLVQLEPFIRSAISLSGPCRMATSGSQAGTWLFLWTRDAKRTGRRMRLR